MSAASSTGGQLRFGGDSMYIPCIGTMGPGSGVNSLTGMPRGLRVVEYQSLQHMASVSSTSDGQSSNIVVKVIESAQDVLRQTNLVMSGGGGYGNFSGKAGYESSHMSHFTSYTKRVFAAISVVNAIEYFDDASLKSEAISLVTTNPNDFRDRFGDYFVQGVVKGGYFMAVIDIYSESEETQTKVAGKVQAGFQGIGKGSVKFSEEVKSLSAQCTINIQYTQRGGQGEEHGGLSSDLEMLCDKINRFAEAVSRHPIPFSVVVTPYKSLLNFPSIPTPLTRSELRERIIELADIRLQVITLHNDLQFVTEHRDLFESPPEEELISQWMKELAEERKKIEKTVRLCEDQGTLEEYQYDHSHIKLPKRKKTQPPPPVRQLHASRGGGGLLSVAAGGLAAGALKEFF